MRLFTIGNPKTEKGESLGYQTHIMHLAPADSSGYEVCPGRSDGCTALCLNTAGRGRFDKTQAARIRKTVKFFEQRAMFLSDLVKDIKEGIRSASRRSLIPVFRPNGTSDLRWEVYGIIEQFPDIQFYDYTKLDNRKNIPTNYHLTYSFAEDMTDSDVHRVMESGMNVAVVFGVKKGQPLPDEWLGYPVHDGDVHDLRFLDPPGHIIGLRAKGRAKGSDSKFVIQVGA
jgi:hypothetical protein